jgi:hypothetical protein
MSSDMMVVPPQTEYGELMSRQDTKAVEVSLQFSTLPLFPNLSTVLAECRGIYKGRDLCCCRIANMVTGSFLDVQNESSDFW